MVERGRHAVKLALVPISFRQACAFIIVWLMGPTHQKRWDCPPTEAAVGAQRSAPHGLRVLSDRQFMVEADRHRGARVIGPSCLSIEPTKARDDPAERGPQDIRRACFLRPVRKRTLSRSTIRTSSNVRDSAPKNTPPTEDMDHPWNADRNRSPERASNAACVAAPHENFLHADDCAAGTKAAAASASSPMPPPDGGSGWNPAGPLDRLNR